MLLLRLSLFTTCRRGGSGQWVHSYSVHSKTTVCIAQWNFLYVWKGNWLSKNRHPDEYGFRQIVRKLVIAEEEDEFAKFQELRGAIEAIEQDEEKDISGV